jgi:hypothetical protein
MITITGTTPQREQHLVHAFVDVARDYLGQGAPHAPGEDGEERINKLGRQVSGEGDVIGTVELESIMSGLPPFGAPYTRHSDRAAGAWAERYLGTDSLVILCDSPGYHFQHAQRRIVFIHGGFPVCARAVVRLQLRQARVSFLVLPIVPADLPDNQIQ